MTSPVPEVLLDTDTLSELIKGSNQKVLRQALLYLQNHRVLTFASPTAMEILFGLYCKDARGQLQRAREAFLRNKEVCPTPEDYRLAAEIAAAVTSLGKPIGVMDPLIAACALNNNLHLATGNVRHFRYIQDAGYQLVIDHWR